MTSIFILAGEASGDRIGADLIAGLRRARPDLSISGVGGDAMEGEGLSSLFSIDDLAVMGYRDVIMRLPLLLWRARQVVSAVQRQNPSVVVLIDAQVFSKVVARTLRKRGYRGTIILYVAPAVWAWGAERARKLAGIFDEVLSVLPFEPAAMQRLGGPKTAYVGHPALGKYPMRPAQPAAGPILLLPGSRRGEIARHLPMMAEVVRRLSKHAAVTGFLILSTRSQAARISRIVAQWPIPVAVLVTSQDRQSAIEQAVAAVAVSGTVTLELALSGVPHILTYVAEGAQVRMFKKATTPFIGLPNIIAGKAVTPEILFAQNGEPDKLADAALALVENADALDLQRCNFQEIRALMEKGAPEAPLQDPVERILAHI
ncbi:lipid-A-disaccharide synthase [Pelagibacterium halotolerans]|uniref:Lipid-A-disaccharide synthase n=1 Tax=Pelagibacterium halotolerans (strain DSM 22347 / JCM 15775 / CGMCC 1.7692 / B2) TaxID=1082931 RepID=G4R8V3_PELHB|nr:lipid-A-disaccharide synthase [Pelagibacterium halotolerans]AEQ51370.1 lipid-A-disaccharide synthase [Pelagibacterium halotolerans B2]QJR18787.1 lipid-A-disaccharide synthase [Pelagibacterium halotolerans]SEA92831.1 lipid-A-disaccharide synthase [Pelagibacterium halotolerans]